VGKEARMCTEVLNERRQEVEEINRDELGADAKAVKGGEAVKRFHNA
jgi:hypothetical protein